MSIVEELFALPIRDKLNLDFKVVLAQIEPDKIVIRIRALIAPAKTASRECLIAIIAAINHVLSPNSETIITDNEAKKA